MQTPSIRVMMFASSFWGALGEAIDDLRLAKQVAEHQHADQCRGAGDDDAADERHEDREKDAGPLADLLEAGVVHPDPSFVAGREQLDDRGLNDRHERHVRIGGHRDRREQVCREPIGDDDGGRSIRGADDADGCGFLEIETEHGGQAHGEEDAELRRRPEEEHLGVLEQGREVDHRPDGDEDEQGKRSVRMPKSNRVDRTPCSLPWVIAPENGMLARMAPKPMGRRRVGSYCFLMASQISPPPMKNITKCCQVSPAIPLKSASIPTRLHKSDISIF
jgi:hypothetical protein